MLVCGTCLVYQTPVCGDSDGPHRLPVCEISHSHTLLLRRDKPWYRWSSFQPASCSEVYPRRPVGTMPSPLSSSNAVTLFIRTHFNATVLNSISSTHKDTINILLRRRWHDVSCLARCDIRFDVALLFTWARGKSSQNMRVTRVTLECYSFATVVHVWPS